MKKTIEKSKEVIKESFKKGTNVGILTGLVGSAVDAILTGGIGSIALYSFGIGTATGYIKGAVSKILSKK